MITTTLFALALAATGSSDAGRASPDIAALTGMSATTAARETKVQKPTLYCIKDTPTGSRIPRTSCRTRAQWIAQGFDPIAPN